jgi:hypothetical protein
MHEKVLKLYKTNEYSSGWYTIVKTVTKFYYNIFFPLSLQLFVVYIRNTRVY